MDASNPVDIQEKLGNVEDLIAQMMPAWSEAAGREAAFAIWERTMYLATKAEMEAEGAFEGMGTETAKKDAIDQRMRRIYPDEYAAHKDFARQKAQGDAVFKGLDTRRSIGQTLLRAHMEDAKGGGHGQGGGQR